MTNPHTSLNDYVVTNIYIFADEDLFSNLGAIAALEALRIGWCLQCLDRDAVTNLGIPPNSDPSRVVQPTISSNCDIFANRDIIAIIAMERCGDIDVPTKVTASTAVHVLWTNPPRRYDVSEVALALASRNNDRRVRYAVELVDNTVAESTLIHQQLVIWQEWFTV